MSQAPTLPIPVGGDQNQGPVVEIVTWVFTSLALITVFLRLLTRLRLTRNPGWDDFWIVLGMVSTAIISLTLPNVPRIPGHSDLTPPSFSISPTRFSLLSLSTLGMDDTHII